MIEMATKSSIRENPLRFLRAGILSAYNFEVTSDKRTENFREFFYGIVIIKLFKS